METHTVNRYTPPVAELGRFQRLGFLVGIALLAVSAIAALLVPIPGFRKQFFHSYLLAYVFWIGIALGSLVLVMVQHLAGGAWGVVIRRVLESSTRTLPLMAILFLPILLGMGDLYHWSHREAVDENEILRLKRAYLNVPFFIIRTIIYFAIWGTLVYFLNKWSAAQDETADIRFANRMQTLSGPGIVLFAITVNFAAVDWVMSLDPEWYSTIFGILFMGGWGLSALSFTIAVTVLLAGRAPLRGVLKPSHFHDLGKLLLAFVMLWAYFNLSQFLIIWWANLPEEVPWYLRRMSGGWQFISVALVMLHFAIPFLLLLRRDLKRNARMLSTVVVLVVVMRFVDSFWLIMPELYKNPQRPFEGHFGISLFDFIVPAAVGAIWLAWFAWQLSKRPLLPINDPLLDKALHGGGGH